MCVTLRYAAATNVNPGAAGTTGVHVFVANDCYDPDYTSTGHQPRGFDQLMPLFSHFTVTGSRIKVDFCARNANVYDQVCGIALRPLASTSSDLYDYIEGRRTVSSVVNSGPSSRHTTLSHSFDARSFFGLQDWPVGLDPYRGDSGSSPSERAYFHVFCAPIQAVDAANVDINCLLEFDVCFTEPVTPVES